MESHYGNQDFFPLTNGVYFIVNLKNPHLTQIANSHITDPNKY